MKRLFAILLLLLFLIPSSPQPTIAAPASIDSIIGQAVMNIGVRELSFKSLLSRGVFPSLTFGGSTDKVNCGTGSTLENLTTASYYAWYYPTSISIDSHLIQKGKFNGTGGRILAVDAGNSIYCQVDGATDGWAISTASTISSANKWWFIAGTHDTTGASTDYKTFVGDLATTVVETGYASQQNEATITSNAAQAQIIGNKDNDGLPANGRIAIVAIWNRVLSVGELQDQQFNPHPTSGCVGFWILGWNGTTSVPDWSGNGNNGATITGTSLSDHVPIKAPF